MSYRYDTIPCHSCQQPNPQQQAYAIRCPIHPWIHEGCSNVQACVGSDATWYGLQNSEWACAGLQSALVQVKTLCRTQAALVDHFVSMRFVEVRLPAKSARYSRIAGPFHVAHCPANNVERCLPCWPAAVQVFRPWAERPGPEYTKTAT